MFSLSHRDACAPRAHFPRSLSREPLPFIRSRLVDRSIVTELGLHQVLKLRNSKRQRSRNNRRERLGNKSQQPAVGDVVEGYVRKVSARIEIAFAPRAIRPTEHFCAAVQGIRDMCVVCHADGCSSCCCDASWRPRDSPLFTHTLLQTAVDRWLGRKFARCDRRRVLCLFFRCGVCECFSSSSVVSSRRTQGPGGTVAFLGCLCLLAPSMIGRFGHASIVRWSKAKSPSCLHAVVFGSFHSLIQADAHAALAFLPSLFDRS